MNRKQRLKNKDLLKITSAENTIFLEGKLILRNVSYSLENILNICESLEKDTIHLNLKYLTQIDTAGTAFFRELECQLREQGKRLSLEKIPRFVESSIETFYPDGTEEEIIHEIPPENLIWENIGDWIYNKCLEFRSFMYLLADIADYALVGLMKKDGVRKGEFYNQCILIGMNALPIIALISYLIGFILALQSASQLRQFGASIYIADLIAISMTREMGPLMTAIILAGRSGSAITSEIATMVVTEETDALKSMALSPIRYVVTPKVYAITLTSPILTIFSMIIGIVGAFTIAITYLNIGFESFYNQVISALVIRDIWTGLIKSIVFAWLIVIVSSFYGFRTTGGAEDVGRSTTKSVVASIFCVILADSLLGLIFYFGQSMLPY